MFELLNIFNKSNSTFRITHLSNSIEFNVSKLVGKRDKEEMDPTKQFVLMEAYLDYKGDSFKKQLMERYMEAEDVMNGLITKTDLLPLPIKIVHNILDMFDLEDATKFCGDVFKVRPPKQLKETFDMQTERDGDGTRVQTYLKSDYIELAALSLALKAALPVVGHFAYLKDAHINGLHKEYLLYGFIAGHKIAKSEPMKKLYGFANKWVEISFKNEDLAAIRVIERGMPREEMSTAILASVVFTKIAVASIIDDYKDKNVITRMHTFVHNKLNVRKDVQKAIRAKNALSDVDGGEGDKESILESYRVSSILPPGFEEELDWAVSDIDILIEQLPTPVDKNIILDLLPVLAVFNTRAITKQQVSIIGVIFKDIIDPRGLAYITSESMVNLLAVGFAYLWSLDSKYLALLLCSLVNDEEDDVMAISTTVNRTRLSKELKDQLEILYPYTRTVNATTTANIVEETLNTLSNDIYSMEWVATVPEKYLEQVVANKWEFKTIPNNLKNLLAEMYIKLESNRI